MKTKYLLRLLLALGVAATLGCGGGGGSSVGGGGGTPTVTTISGVVSKGIFVSGKVRVYAVNADGAKGNLLQTADINPDGSYTANVGSYVGPVVVEASGNYKDEATGAIKTVADTAPLRAAVENASGEIKVAITALTEIAVQKVEDPSSKKITVADIDQTNKLVGDTFHVADIINTLPVDATVEAPANALAEQKEYALALAAVSQMMTTPAYAGMSLGQVITAVKDAIDGTGSLATDSAIEFQAALQAFAADTSKNKTGMTDVTATNLVNIGGSSATVKLKTTGSGSTLAGIQVTLTLPAGVTVKAESGSPLNGAVATSGVAPSDALFQARYVPSQGGLAQLVIFLSGKEDFGAGEFVTIKCDVGPGVTLTSASFTSGNFSNYKPVDSNGTTLLDLYPSVTAEVL